MNLALAWHKTISRPTNLQLQYTDSTGEEARKLASLADWMLDYIQLQLVWMVKAEIFLDGKKVMAKVGHAWRTQWKSLKKNQDRILTGSDGKLCCKCERRIHRFESNEHQLTVSLWKYQLILSRNECINRAYQVAQQSGP